MSSKEYMKIIKDLIDQVQDVTKCYCDLSEKYILLLKENENLKRSK